jgi:hypothetical protein
MSFKDFIGTWKLVSFERRHGDEVTYPGGKDPVGLLIYNHEGYMSVHITARDRKHFESEDRALWSDEEKIAATEAYAGYGGRFEVLEDKVLHHVDVSFIPNHVGITRERFYEFKADRLTLSTPPMLFHRKMGRGYLIWEKIKTNE